MGFGVLLVLSAEVGQELIAEFAFVCLGRPLGLDWADLADPLGPAVWECDADVDHPLAAW